MWNDYGFVSHIFESFKNNGLDINIITTSQFSVMVTTNEINSFKLIKCNVNFTCKTLKTNSVS